MRIRRKTMDLKEKNLIERQAEESKKHGALIGYIAMMSDVELPREEENEEGGEFVEK